jgi:dolichyl-phosphate-mannose-protein mannosyltransferase
MMAIRFRRLHAAVWAAVLLAILAAVLRVGVGAANGTLTRTPFGDELLFDPIARHLVDGEGYTINGELPTAIRPPVYPVILAAAYAVSGQSRLAGRLLNIVINSVTVLMIVALGAVFFGLPAGLLAGAAAAIYPPWLDLSARLLSDQVYLLLLLILAFQLHRADVGPPTFRRWAIAGILLALCILTRSEAVSLLVLLPAGLLLARGTGGTALRQVLALSAPAVLLTALWVARNQAVLGSAVLASNLGQALYGVYQPKMFGNDDLLGTWAAPVPEVWNLGQHAPGSRKGNGQYLPEPDYNRVLTHRAVVSARQHARQLPRLSLAKLNRFFLSRGHAENLMRFGLVSCFVFGELLLLANGWRATWPLQVLLAANLLVGLILYTDNRLRMPGDTVFFLVGSYGVIQLRRVLRGQSA